MNNISKHANRKARSPHYLPVVAVVVMLSVIGLGLGGCRPLCQTEEAAYTEGVEAARNTQARAESVTPYFLKYDTASKREITGDHGCAAAILYKTFQGLVIEIGKPTDWRFGNYDFTATVENDYNESVDENRDGADTWNYVGHNKVTITGKYSWAEGKITEGTFDFSAVGYRTSSGVPFTTSEYKVEYNFHYTGSCYTKEIAEPYVTPPQGTTVLLLSKGTKNHDEHRVWDGGNRTGDHNYNREWSFVLPFVVAD